MSFCRKCLVLFLSIASVHAADKNDAKFTPGPASSYPHKQTISKVTIAASVVETDEQARPPFGKLNPYEHGVLPVLVVIQNDSAETLRIEGLQAEYVGPDRRHVEATPAKDVPYLHGPTRPTVRTSPIPRRSRKSPLAAFEIEARAFAAKMLPPGESASGFFYFQTIHRKGSLLYLTGIQEASSGKDLFYFEVPLGDPVTAR